MRKHRDAQGQFDEHMTQAADAYVVGLRERSMKPTSALTRKVAERALHEARADYYQEAVEMYESNVQEMIRDHEKRMNQIKRSGAKLRMWTYSFIALIFGVAAWYCFSRDVVIMGLAYGVAALAFLVMLIYGALFDRPTNV